MKFNLFGKKKGPARTPYAVDLHSHLIPGIDDGVKSIEESINMIRRLAGMGVSRIITTPHIMGDFYKNTPEIIREGEEKVRDAIEKENIDITFKAAAEYYLDEFFLSDLKKEKEILTLNDQIVLFELPYINAPIQMDEAIFIMQSNGYKPLLAHPERYSYYHHDLDRLKEIRDKGVMLQLNLNSLIGYYSRPVQKMARKLIKNRMIDFVGSDAHNERHLDVMEDCLRSKKSDILEQIPLLNNTLLKE